MQLCTILDTNDTNDTNDTKSNSSRVVYRPTHPALFLRVMALPNLFSARCPTKRNVRASASNPACYTVWHLTVIFVSLKQEYYRGSRQRLTY